MQSMAIHRKTRINRSDVTRSVPVRLATGGMLATLLIGGVTAATIKKDVVLDVNGEQVPLSTMSSTVDGVLSQAGVHLGDQDFVSPSPDSSVSSHDVITVRTAKQVALVVEGQEKTITTTAVDVQDLLGELDEVSAADVIDRDQDEAIPESGLKLSVTKPKIISINDGGNITYTSIAAKSVGDVLAQRNIELDADDRLNLSPETAIAQNLAIVIDRVETSEVSENISFDLPATYIDDSEATAGEEVVLEQGKSGTKDITRKITTVNGIESVSEIIKETEVQAATPSTIKRGTKTVAANSVWDSLAQCEAGGNWAIDTGNGFSGGLQFHPQTWQAYGGGAYSATASGATREQQISIGEKVQAAQGWGAWPACTASLGIR